MKNFFEKHSIMVITCTILAIFVLGLFINAEMSLSHVSVDSQIDLNDGPDWNLNKSVRAISDKTIEIDYGLLAYNYSKTNDYLIVADSSKQSVDYTGCYGNMYNSEGMLKSCLISSLQDINSYDLFQQDANSNKNSVSLMTFNNNYNLIESYMNSSSTYREAVRQIQGSGQANYEKALAGIRDFIEHYDKNRDLKVIVILNSLSIGDHEKEKEEYRKLKEDYPDVPIVLVCKSVKNDNDLEKVQGISDSIFFADGNQVDSDFDEYEVPSNYDNYENDTKGTFQSIYYGFGAAIDGAIFSATLTKVKITDIIDKRYLDFNSFKIIRKTSGVVAYNIVDGEPTLTWTFNKGNPVYYENYLKVQLNIKDGVETDSSIPVSTSTNITYKIGDTENTLSTTDTPYAFFKYSVDYDTYDLPTNCVLENVPDYETYAYNEVVDLSNKVVSCEGYIFNGWIYNNPFNNTTTYIDGDMFNMPAYDIVLTPNIGKVSISKKIDEYNDQVAYLDVGKIINKKIKLQLYGAGQIYNSVGGDGNNYKKITRSNSLPDNFEVSNEKIISLSNSPVPVYMWTNSDTIYYYSTATKIYLNPDSSYIFNSLQINDISDLVYLDASKVKSFEYAFGNNYFTDLSALLNWDVSSVTNMDSMFSGVINLNINGLSNWNVSNVTNMSGLFAYAYITNIDALSNWDVSSVTNMSGTFVDNSFTNLDALSNWDVSNVENMEETFYFCTHLSNIDGISNWNVSRVKSMARMFNACSSLADPSAINDWNIINVQNFSGMFSSRATHPEFTKVTGSWNYGTFIPNTNGGN